MPVKARPVEADNGGLIEAEAWRKVATKMFRNQYPTPGMLYEAARAVHHDMELLNRMIMRYFTYWPSGDADFIGGDDIIEDDYPSGMQYEARAMIALWLAEEAEHGTPLCPLCRSDEHVVIVRH